MSNKQCTSASEDACGHNCESGVIDSKSDQCAPPSPTDPPTPPPGIATCPGGVVSHDPSDISNHFIRWSNCIWQGQGHVITYNIYDGEVPEVPEGTICQLEEKLDER